MLHELDLSGYHTNVPLFTEFVFRYRDAVLAAEEYALDNRRDKTRPTREEYARDVIERRNRRWFPVFKALGFNQIPTAMIAEYLGRETRGLASKLRHFERHHEPLVTSTGGKRAGAVGGSLVLWTWIGPMY